MNTKQDMNKTKWTKMVKGCPASQGYRCCVNGEMCSPKACAFLFLSRAGVFTHTIKVEADNEEVEKINQQLREFRNELQRLQMSQQPVTAIGRSC